MTGRGLLATRGADARLTRPGAHLEASTIRADRDFRVWPDIATHMIRQTIAVGLTHKALLLERKRLLTPEKPNQDKHHNTHGSVLQVGDHKRNRCKHLAGHVPTPFSNLHEAASLRTSFTHSSKRSKMKQLQVCVLALLTLFPALAQAQADMTPGKLHPTNDLAVMPTFTQTGPAPTLNTGDSLYGLAVLSQAPQDLFADKKEVTMVQTLTVGDAVIAELSYVVKVKKIKGSQVLPVNFIPDKRDSAGEDWTVRFALALADLPAGEHQLTLSISSPDADPPLLAQGTMTYVSSGDKAPYMEKAMLIAHKNKATIDRKPDFKGEHNITLNNTCKKAKTVVIIEDNHGAMRFKLKPKASAEVNTTPGARIYMNKKPRIDAEKIMNGGALDLCI